jgi:hypothetical protein
MSAMTRPTLRLLLAGSAAGAALALSAASALAAPNLSGYWVLQSDPEAAPAASLTPAAAKRLAELRAAKGLDAIKGSVEYARVWCLPEGVPWQDTHTLPVSVQQSPLTVTITYSTESQPRHIYLDGQPHPDEETFDFLPVGHSIGRWQGDTLVTSTRYFKDGVDEIPGGALRSEKSRLTERWRLADKDTLRVTSTWTDPTTLRRPHTYTSVYKRAQGTVWMTESQCSPIPNMRAKGLHVPFDAKD